MSIQSEINRLKQNVSAAFTAIGNKGGTVPYSKVSGNLANAINSIPGKVAVQKKSGSFTTSGSLAAFTINCGFKPDYVIFTQGKANEYSYGTYPLNTAAVFESSDFFDAPLWEIADNYATNGLVYDISGTRNNNVISGNIYVATTSLEFKPFIGTFQYIAIKYTE